MKINCEQISFLKIIIEKDGGRESRLRGKHRLSNDSHPRRTFQNVHRRIL